MNRAHAQKREAAKAAYEARRERAFRLLLDRYDKYRQENERLFDDERLNDGWEWELDRAWARLEKAEGDYIARTLGFTWLDRPHVLWDSLYA